MIIAIFNGGYLDGQALAMESSNTVHVVEYVPPHQWGQAGAGETKPEDAVVLKTRRQYYRRGQHPANINFITPKEIHYLGGNHAIYHYWVVDE